MKTIDPRFLAHICGGARQSARSNPELVTLLKQTNDAVSDLVRNQKSSTDSSSTMLPMMMMMMHKR